MEPTIVEINYNIMDSYSDFIIKLRETLADHVDREDVCDHPVLPKQQCPKVPARWIYINLLGDTDDRTTLAVRDDNVYLIGFKNKSGKWYEFGYKKNSKRMLPKPNKSIFLECDVKYRSIVGGIENLVHVEVGHKSTSDAVCCLSGYTQARDGTEEASNEIRRNLACLIVTICEGARMIPHHDRVMRVWRSDGLFNYIDEDEVYYAKFWGDTSEALLRWCRLGEQNFPKRLRKIGIIDPNTALEIVYLLLNRPTDGPATWDRRSQRIAAGHHGRSQQQPPFYRSRTQQQPDQVHGRFQPPPPPPPNPARGRSHSEQQETPGASDNYEWHGRPLVEVLSVRVGFPLVGSIAVFDGMRGQIIYEYDNDAANHDSPPSGDLLLTGPYTAISAYGSFTIEVDIPEPDTQGESSDVGELNWDCYNEDNKYDELISSTITTEGGREVEVTYAVLSYAVEAKVEVRLYNLPDETRVYGRITARSDDSEALSGSDGEAWPWIVLFDLKAGEAVTVGSGSTVLPLARSVVALPAGSLPEIHAELCDHAAGSPFFSQHLKLIPGDDASKLRINNGGEVELKITSPDLCRSARPSSTTTSPATSCRSQSSASPRYRER